MQEHERPKEGYVSWLLWGTTRDEKWRAVGYSQECSALTLLSGKEPWEPNNSKPGLGGRWEEQVLGALEGRVCLAWGRLDEKMGVVWVSFLPFPHTSWKPCSS